MPFNMAMEQPDSGIVSLEAEHNVATGVYGNGITAHGHGWKVSSVAVESPCA
jgi:hypothetical protein